MTNIVARVPAEALRVAFDNMDLDFRQLMSGTCRWFRARVDFGVLARRRLLRSAAKFGSWRLLMYVANRFGATDWADAFVRTFNAGHKDIAVLILPRIDYAAWWHFEHAFRFAFVEEFEFAFAKDEWPMDEECPEWGLVCPQMRQYAERWEHRTEAELFAKGYNGVTVDINNEFNIRGLIWGGHKFDPHSTKVRATVLLSGAREAGRADLIEELVDMVFASDNKYAFDSVETNADRCTDEHLDVLRALLSSCDGLADRVLRNAARGSRQKMARIAIEHGARASIAVKFGLKHPWSFNVAKVVGDRDPCTKCVVHGRFGATCVPVKPRLTPRAYCGPCRAMDGDSVCGETDCAEHAKYVSFDVWFACGGEVLCAGFADRDESVASLTVPFEKGVAVVVDPVTMRVIFVSREHRGKVKRRTRRAHGEGPLLLLVTSGWNMDEAVVF